VDIFKADWLEKIDLEAMLQKQVMSRGFRSKASDESLEHFRVILRPFRKIILNATRSRINESFKALSLIDEELFPFVTDENHQMLLWRPKYFDSTIVSQDMDYESSIDEDALQKVIDEIMEKRWQSQDYNDELRPKLKRLQMDPLAVITFMIPRTPAGLRKEQAIIDDRKESHAYVLATSLLTNTSPRDIITSAELGETVLIETIIANYKSEDESSRLLFLETPSTNSFSEAIKTGKALTRLCELYGECREIVSNTPK
jgi:hypothetical protein